MNLSELQSAMLKLHIGFYEFTIKYVFDIHLSSTKGRKISMAKLKLEKHSFVSSFMIHVFLICIYSFLIT